MTRRDIIARSVQNLTDARYFAAWMVKYMSFDLRKDSINFIGAKNVTEIINWLAGPTFLGDFSGHSDLNFIVETCKELNLSGVIMDNKMYAEELSKSVDVIFYETDNFELIGETKVLIICKLEHQQVYRESGHKVYLHGNALPLNIIKSIPIDVGLGLQGGEEIKTGLKSFDQLDEIFDVLAEE